MQPSVVTKALIVGAAQPIMAKTVVPSTSMAATSIPEVTSVVVTVDMVMIGMNQDKRILKLKK